MTRLRHQARLAAFIATLGFACDSEPPDFPELAEPTEALRPAELRGVVPADARTADYEMDVSLDGEAHVIEGSARITWRNRTRRTVDRVPLHLYMNGFRAEDTAWMSEGRGSHRGYKLESGGFGYIDIQSIERVATWSPESLDGDLEVPNQPAVALEYSEDDDPSTMTVTLDREVGPGQALVLDIEFKTKLPRVFARTGYADDFHFAGQWFPKIGVLEEEDGWKAHTFTSTSEFYADFGNYDVRLDVPESLVVGASGIRVEEAVEGDRKKLRYRAEMVHDFAWTGDPDFVEHYFEHEGIRVRQLIQPEHVGEAQAHADAQIAALDSMQSRFGPYPWSTITIVHPPKNASGAGGMEYPTLYTTWSQADFPRIPDLLDERMSGTFTTVHEFGHQYFQGLFASNEYAQPWLDEGINTMSNNLTYDDAYGQDPWAVLLMGHALTTEDIARLAVGQGEELNIIDQDAASYPEVVGDYGIVVYQKTAAVMLTLRHVVGHKAFDDAFALYSERARFRHPTGATLEQSLIDSLGDRVVLAEATEDEPAVELDVQDFLDQALRGSDRLDFEVRLVRNRPRLGHAGYHREDDGTLLLTELEERGDLEDLDDEDLEGLAIIHRPGGVEMPVDVLFEFADGSTEARVARGRARYEIFTFPGKRIQAVVIDPDRKLVFESERFDNVAYAKGVDHPHLAVRAISTASEAVNLTVLGGFGP